MSEWPGKKHVGIPVIFVNTIASNDAYKAKGRVGHVYPVMLVNMIASNDVYNAKGRVSMCITIANREKL